MDIKRHPIISGTMILTAAGLFTRIVGFYYKIFLSRNIGAEALGIYQLSMPFLSIGIAVTCSGIHTSISRYVAACSGGEQRETASSYLAAGLLMSLGICGLLFMPCYLYCDKIAAFFFHEPSCAPILRILIFAIPLECIHSCINGYYYGKQKANIPAFGQCIEQIVRVLCVYLIFCICQKENIPFRETHAALGLLLGEIAATIYFVTMISLERFSRPRLKTTVSAGRRLAVMSYPITLNRVSLNTLNGLENTFIPERLIAFGFSSTEALSVYGVFSGMAMPVILFPNVLSNSVSVMLLPMIAKAAGERRFSYISRTIRLAFFLCMLLGFGCSLGFFLLGNFVGDFLFGNELAGDFIRLLCWICPFLFLNATFSSILNGLGQTKATFLISMTGSLTRLIFIYFSIPAVGFQGYVMGILISQVVTAFLSYRKLTGYLAKQP